jgi:predicted DNA-binding transcriptional regulator AlpA
MRARMLRIGEICRALGCQKSALYANYIRTGRLKMYPLGTRTVGALESDVDALVRAIVNGGAIDYRAPLHARRRARVAASVGRPPSVGKRKPDALVYDGAGRLVGEAWKV